MVWKLSNKKVSEDELDFVKVQEVQLFIYLFIYSITMRW